MPYSVSGIHEVRTPPRRTPSIEGQARRLRLGVEGKRRYGEDGATWHRSRISESADASCLLATGSCSGEPELDRQLDRFAQLRRGERALVLPRRDGLLHQGFELVREALLGRQQ